MTLRQKLNTFLDQTAVCLSLLFFVFFAWHQWWAGVSPRLIRGSAEREEIHHDHLAMGATLFVIITLAIIVWLLRSDQKLSDKIRQAFSNAASTAISLFFISCFFNLLYGLAQAWAAGEETKVLSVFKLPHFLEVDWSTSGYMHSALSSINMMLFAGIAFVFLFTKLKAYVKPGVAVALLILLHLLVSLPKPPSPHPIAAFGTYVMIPFFYFVALALYCWAKDRKRVYWPVYILFIGYFMYLPFFAFKMAPPWHPKPDGDVVIVEPSETLIAARPQSEIFSQEGGIAAAKEIGAWCFQCHNTTESATHLFGPNLAGVFNRQAGTVEGYDRYSEAMIAKGLEGTYWSRENLAKFLSDGPKYIPGNGMNQRTDLSDPARMKLLLDYLEHISSTDPK